MKQRVVEVVKQTGDALPTVIKATMSDVRQLEQPIDFPLVCAAVNRGVDEVGRDILVLRLLCLYGLKRAAAYLDRACPDTRSGRR